MKAKFTTTHINIYTQRNSKFINYKQYKFLNIKKKYGIRVLSKHTYIKNLELELK